MQIMFLFSTISVTYFAISQKVGYLTDIAMVWYNKCVFSFLHGTAHIA